MTTFLQHLAWQLGSTDDPWKQRRLELLAEMDRVVRETRFAKPAPVFKRVNGAWCWVCGAHEVAGEHVATGIRYFCREHL